MDRFNSIKVFCRVVELNSFTKAADALDMPKTTVSKKVADLEAMLGVRLLNRTTRSVQPTAEGKAYYAQTSRWLRELDDIDDTLDAHADELCGRVLVDLGVWVAAEVVMPHLPAFHAKYPDIQVDINVCTRPTLQGTEADCAIVDGCQVGTYPFYIVYSSTKHRNQRVRIVIDWLAELCAGAEP